jgi:hypothetical protein
MEHLNEKEEITSNFSPQVVLIHYFFVQRKIGMEIKQDKGICKIPPPKVTRK